ncbi:patatin-like phospholipase family protein [Thalassobellus suaedae]|uniref:Patatin-like phospholipase family protein n=1 Tax=Thalassobellus suaedae TaxID=3074124 RepID=A0ABY9XPD4_9FLAO|nr:patatin-like phospholipase family protein [Flavobacteriaceae bacterium HL-DH14]WNH13108.1 patatin-like phospholipase family protein [Flavobacteriaceae bacterium HL-DH10]
MNIGLVLSGGGMRGAAHVGAIKALEEHNIFPTHIAGASAGAIVGGLYAHGYNCDEMLHFFKTVQLLDYKKYALNKPGFIDTNKYYDFFKKKFPEDSFSVLKKKLFITTTNITDGVLQIFNDGEIIKPMLASSAFPGLFSPVKIKEKLYIDGGVLNNFPIELIKKDCDTLIGVYLNHFETAVNSNLKHFYNVIERAINIRIAKSDEEKFTDFDIVIAPKNLTQYSLFDKKNIDAIYKIGYDNMNRTLKNNTLIIKKENLSTLQL